MDRSYTYSRRLVSRARLRKRMAAVAAAGLATAVAVFMLTWKPDPISVALPSFMPVLALNDGYGASQPFQRGVRRFYPYSVVPGGVSDQAELKRIIRTDSVVAAHYATFNTDDTRAFVVDKPRAVHVSYRKGDKVYWTAHKLMLAPGETLLTDGRNEMRARCANRISDLPQYPVEAHKPAMAELDQAVELAEGEEYVLGPDGMPVAMGGEAGIGHHPGGRSATRSGSGNTGSAATPADSPLASTLSSRSGSIGPVSTMGLSGAANSMGSRPRPTSRPGSVPAPAPATPAALEPVPESDSGSSGGSSGSPAPIGDAGGGEPVAGPVPGTTAPLPPAEPAAPPGTVPEPEPVTEAPTLVPVPPSAPGKAPPSQPAPVTEPVVTKPTPEPLPPQPIEQPAPAEVPEPASLWLFGLALAAMLVLRRPRRTP